MRQTPKIKAYLAEYRRKHADRIRRVKSDWRRRNHERITRCQLKKLKPSQSLFTVFAALPPGFEADARPTLLTPYEMLALKEEVVR